MSKIFNINLDIKKNNYICLGEFKIGDNLSQINGTMLQNGQAYDLTGLKLRVNYRDSKGELYFQDESKGVSIINPLEGTFKIDVLSSVLSVEGIIKADISIFKNKDKLTSSTFSMEVVDTIYKDNAIVGADGKDLLQEIIEGEGTRKVQEIEREKNEVKRKEIVQIATNSNTSLQDTINTSIAKDTVLKATIVDSIAKDNILKNTINDSVTKDTVLKSTIVKAEDKKKDLDDIIGFKVSDYVTKTDLDNQTLATLTTSSTVTSLENATDGIMQIDSIKGRTRYKKASGEYTDTWEEGVKLESTGELEGNKIEASSKGGNLFDKQKNTTGGRINESTGGIYIGPPGDGYSDYIKIEPNTNYIFNGWGQGVLPSAWYDVAKKFIKGHSPIANQAALSPSNASFLRISTYKMYLDTTQIKKGTIPTTYEPYKEDKNEILLKSPHMGIPNAQDEIVGDKLVKRVGRRLFTGSAEEPWVTAYPLVNSLCFIISIKHKANQFSLCNNFKQYPSIAENDYEGFAQNGSSMYFRILKSKLTTPDLAGFKKWLSENPTEVYYELAEPIITTINPTSLKSFKDGSIILNNAIPPTVTLNYPTSVSGRLSSVETTLDNTVDSVTNLWFTMLHVADKELKMKSIPILATETNTDLKNKLNEIINIWR